MKVVIAASVCCIVVSLVDRTLFGGRLVETFPLFLKAVAKGFFG